MERHWLITAWYLVALISIVILAKLISLLPSKQRPTGVYVQHLAATPINTEVRGVATFLGNEGKLYKFKVEAFDAGGKIGEGEHTRTVVDTERLLTGARKRVGKTL